MLPSYTQDWLKLGFQQRALELTAYYQDLQPMVDAILSSM
jgi:hypothetical protein